MSVCRIHRVDEPCTCGAPCVYCCRQYPDDELPERVRRAMAEHPGGSAAAITHEAIVAAALRTWPDAGEDPDPQEWAKAMADDWMTLWNVLALLSLTEDA